MAANVTTPHRPFDRLWQPGHPFRARRSRGRKWTMAMLLIFMSAVISSYWYLTDPLRIKAMSQVYLSDLTGGSVEIGSASLTIFQGLKLAHVIVKVDRKNAPDSVLLVTDAIEIQYNPSSLLRGKLQATRIIATGARVKLVEDAAGHWNYQRLKPRHESAVTLPSGAAIPLLPQVVLRDAKVEYSELRNGERISRGAVAIEGRAFPSSDGSRLEFDVQSRGELGSAAVANSQSSVVPDGIGPVARGDVILKTGEMSATLSRFKFGRDLQTMLPREVRDFWVAHKFEGELDIPEFNYKPASGGHPASFRVRSQLKHVNLIVRARELETPAVPATEPPLATHGLFSTVDEYETRLKQTLERWRVLPEQPPMVVNDVSGTFLFDEHGIKLNQVFGSIASTTIEINGRVDGYTADAPLSIRIESPKPIYIPAHPDYLASLPIPARIAFLMVHPQGTGTIWIDVQRDKADAAPRITGELNVIDGAFDTVFFPYPARGASGKIAFFPDTKGHFERVELRGIHAHGLIGGPNEHNELLADGWLGGDNPDVGCVLHFSSPLIVAEPALFAALPPPARHALKIFTGVQGEKYLRGTGGFSCEVYVPPGHGKVHPVVSVDLNLIDGAGRFTAFPYPLEKVHGIVNIRDGYVDIKNLNLAHGNATVSVNGRVSWPANLPDDVPAIVTPNVHLVARNVPVDEELIDVLPADAQQWIRAMGVTGMIDVDGPVILQPTASDPGAIGFHLGVTLRDAKARPPESNFAISDAGGKLVVDTDKVQVLELHGHRGDAELKGGGVVDWSSGQPQITMNATATHLALDEPLRKLMPDAGRTAWAAVDPHGAINAELFLAGTVPNAVAKTAQTANTGAAKLPLDLRDFKLVLHPAGLSVEAQAVPYRLDNCTGSITVGPKNIAITNFGGLHGNAQVHISGRGLTLAPADWDFSMTSRDVPVDADLTKALPQAMRQLISDLKFKGDLSVDLKSMKYRGEHRADAEPDIDINGNIHTRNATLNAGMPLTDMTGDLGFNAAVRRGKLRKFHGDLGLDSVSFADRPVSGFKATLDLAPGSDTVKIGGIQGQIAGGDIAGDVKLRFPDQGPSSYSMDFAIKNADLREVARQVAPKGQEIRGQVSASLALQGDWDDPKTRRGRGDVLVSGKQMYQIPLLLGLMDVTNLSLPTTSPFNEGTARYLVEGQRVTFEQVQMRSDQMVMSGNGWLDFDTRKVRMNFTTENPNIPQVPIIHDLIAGAKNELLQIQVRGTVQNPTVSAGSFHTFTTTVDEVFSGGEK